MHPPAHWIARLRASLAAARLGIDAEAVHDVRVAAARLRVGLELAGRDALRADLRWLRRACGRARDLDVAAELTAERVDAAEFAGWLAHERALEQAPLASRLQGERVAGLLEALELAGARELRAESPAVPARSAPALARHLRRAVRAGARFELEPQCVERAHELRRRLRKLRHAREWLGLDAQPIERATQALGACNDRSTARALLRESPLAPRLAALEARLTQELELARRGALAAWSALQQEGAWTST